jgi:hypothetical protein
MQTQQGVHTGKDANITPSYSSLPFMEIREEFDQYGNEIKSEVMNMSKVVQNVKREIESKKGSGETKSNEMLEALLQSILHRQICIRRAAAAAEVVVIVVGVNNRSIILKRKQRGVPPPIWTIPMIIQRMILTK